ncbi:G-type lectin S-receptor-like serine/threonine-protein kinase At1g11330 isoform X2 [Rhodamnia argentea]|uniref:Receptor-like serine/threonine-protein kinase n=1 Tax=Rhodamnia argentea TaxID=178133 RepID=A0ABM3HYJ9_9MYRT|nr:G-type lectin S-receptor-like serine/threonine-protein kinase At1g11330 isoform X2 [Rhodamnia argentea]
MTLLRKANLFTLVSMLCCALKFCVGGDVITATEHIQDPGSIVSSGGLYKLGFFSPNSSANRYVGIWHNKIPAYSVLWVANRDKPILDSTGVMMISDDGNLVLMNGKKEVIWSSNVSTSITNSSAQILDSGNLVLIKGSSSSVANDSGILWQSFDHGSDSFLSTMKLSTSVRTNEKHVFTSWESPSDPSIGSFSLSLELLNIPEVVIWNGSTLYWRSGPWNGSVFIGIYNMRSVYLDGWTLVNDKEGTIYLTYNFAEASYISYFLLKSNGIFVQPYWHEEQNDWQNVWLTRDSLCDVYGTCGPFGICDTNTVPICSCLRGFEPKNIEEWGRGNWSAGCVRRSSLQCERIINGRTKAGKEDGFLKIENAKVPYYAVLFSPLEDQCQKLCLNNCSCAAYAYDAGIGCMYWSGDLIDIQKFSIEGADLYIRLAHTEFGEKRDLRVIIATAVIVGTIVFIVLCFFWRKLKKRRVRRRTEGEASLEVSGENMLGEKLGKANVQELVLYKLEELATATSNFSDTNRLAQGGFGPVYKGRLSNGKEIAVKRLSKASGQGFREFMNEMEVICKVQHQNLVKILGCCVEGDENIIIYEFMPNKSLDTFLFDPLKREHLDWRRRSNIIDGICRALLYLHRDSRLRIIHRDLKASNILLDEELNPKISDFGMARIFEGNEDQANTRRVMGTYGYMAPEYAMEGRFSEKSDVFSFGVLLLEIISGRRNTSSIEEDRSLSLLGFAWKLWKEGNALALADPKISVRRFETEVLRCVNVGLLCTQLAKDRPTIPTVISLLHGEMVDLPSPNQPAYTERQPIQHTDGSEQSQNRGSINVTLASIEGR